MNNLYMLTADAAVNWQWNLKTLTLFPIGRWNTRKKVCCSETNNNNDNNNNLMVLDFKLSPCPVCNMFSFG